MVIWVEKNEKTRRLKKGGQNGGKFLQIIFQMKGFYRCYMYEVICARD